MPTTKYQTETRHHLRWEIAKYVTSAIILALGYFGAVWLSSLAEPPATQKSDALIQQVSTYEVQPFAGMLDLVVSGSVVPHREIKLAAEVSGRVIEKFLACDAGNFVSKGEPLLRIDEEEYQLEIKTLEADVRQSQQRIEENLQQIAGEERNIELAQSDLKLQQSEVARNARLSGVLSQSELDQSQRALNSAQTQLATRENNLATLKAGTARLRAALEFSQRQLEKAKLNLRRTIIVAPDDGVIVREMVQEGDYVAKGSQIVTFEDTRKSEVLCNLTPADLRWIRENADPGLEPVENAYRSVYQIPKTDVTIYDPADPTISWRGTLERFDGIGRDEVTKTIPCRIVVPKPIVETPSGPRALVRGMFVKCRVEVQRSASSDQPKLLMFPAVGLHTNNHVWTVQDNKLNRVNVKVVDRTEIQAEDEVKKFVIVASEEEPLTVGDQVVVSPLSQPTHGAPVIFENRERAGQAPNRQSTQEVKTETNTKTEQETNPDAGLETTPAAETIATQKSPTEIVN